MSNIKEVKHIVIHHSAGNPNLTVEQIRAMHIAKGWSDIGYHKVIESDGDIKQGRNDAVQGAQAFGANAYSLGVLVVGDFMKVKPNELQIKGLIQVLAVLCKRYKLDVNKIVGHRDIAKLFNTPEGATLCPGDQLYNILPEIRTKVKKYL